MLEFGKLQVVEKTFTRKDSAPRGQAWGGLKFRRYDSKKAGEDSVVEVFILANEAYEALELENYALIQANFNGVVYLLVAEDQDAVEPIAKFMRRSKKRDGSLQEKGKQFQNTFLKDELISVGVLDPDTRDNQYMSLTKVELAGAPSQIKAAYTIAKDTTVDAAADTEDQQEVASSDRDFN